MSGEETSMERDEPLVAQGRCDAVTDLAELFPTQVLLTLLPVATVGTASPKM